MRTTRLCGYFLLFLGSVGSGCAAGESEELSPKTIQAPIINGNLGS